MLPKSINYSIWKTALLPLIDFFAIIFGAGLVYLVRYRWYSEAFFDNTNVLRSSNYITFSIALAACILVVYVILGLYELNSKSNRNFLSVFARLAFGIIVVLLGVIAYYFFNEYNRAYLPSRVSISRFILASGGFFILYTVSLGRLLVWSVEQILYKFGIGLQDVVLVCYDSTALVNWLTKRSDVGKIHHYKSLSAKNYDQIIEMIKNKEVSEIYLYSNSSPLESKLAAIAERYKVLFAFRPVSFGQYSPFSMKPIPFGDYVLLEVSHTNLEGWMVVLKRLFDIVFSLSFLIVFSWLYLIIYIAIKIDSEGSAFYLNDRVGPDGNVFKLWKFRRFKQEFCTTDGNKSALEYEKELIAKSNMKKDDGPLYKVGNDPRMTRVGRFLEKTSLDELPQFINVLKGDMSVVGPRPHQPREVEKYKDEHFKVLNIKPGITGIAQTNGRSDLTFEREVFYDKYYVEHWSFWLDIWIIIRTPLTLIFSRQKS